MRIVPMRVLVAMALLLAAPLARLSAQEPLRDRPRLEELRRRVRERVARRVQDELRLDDQQMRRLRTTVATFGGARRELESRQRSLREALAGQLRPGVAADPDSVAHLMRDLLDARVQVAESYRAEQAEMASYLDPVQRARIALLRERLAERGGPRRRPLLEGRRTE